MEDDEELCSICLEELFAFTDEPSPVVKLSNCNHLFHAKCFLNSFAFHGEAQCRCPNCRASVAPKDIVTTRKLLGLEVEIESDGVKRIYDCSKKRKRLIRTEEANKITYYKTVGNSTVMTRVELLEDGVVIETQLYEGCKNQEQLTKRVLCWQGEQAICHYEGARGHEYLVCKESPNRKRFYVGARGQERIVRVTTETPKREVTYTGPQGDERVLEMRTWSLSGRVYHRLYEGDRGSERIVCCRRYDGTTLTCTTYYSGPSGHEAMILRECTNGFVATFEGSKGEERIVSKRRRLE